MNSQLYIAASGLLVEERRLELVTNNLANASTGGFRAQRAFSSMYQKLAADAGARVRASNQAVALAGTYEVPGPGPLTPTGRGLDVALDPGDLLVVETTNGRGYTRDGALTVSPDGELTDVSGRRVLGAEGKPIGGLDANAVIAADGRVRSDDAVLGRLLVVRDPDQVLRHQGSNLYTAAGGDAALETVAEPRVDPGWLEGSGTDALGELILLIESQRAFEGYQRLISMTMNDVNRKAVNELAG